MLLQLISDTDRRGAQVFAVDLHAALAARSRAVRTVALVPGTYRRRVDVPVLGHGTFGLSTLRSLRAEMSVADIVVAHGSSTLPTSAIAGAALDVPVVYRQISDSLFWANTAVRRARVRASLWRMEAVVALWGGAASTLVEHFGVDEGKVSIISNGVPAGRHRVVSREERATARRRFDLSPDRHTLLYVGALVEEKGVDVVMRALEVLLECQLLVVGDGPLRPGLEALAASVAPGRVCFVGSLDSPVDAYAAAEVVVLPSRGGDSMPAVLIEAGLSGLPAVATTVAGIPEIVVDGVTGRLVPPADPVAFSQAVADVLARPAELGRAARRRCLERFEMDVVAAAWERLLDEVVSR